MANAAKATSTSNKGEKESKEKLGRLFDKYKGEWAACVTCVVEEPRRANEVSKKGRVWRLEDAA